MSIERNCVGWAFWLQWVLASTVAVLVGFALVAAGRIVGVPLPEGLPGYVVIGAVLGGSVGLAQWLVLRRQISYTGWPRGTWWVLSSIVGLAMGLGVGFAPGGAMRAVGSALPKGLAGVLLGVALLGTLVGVMQWFLLRRQVSRSGWWILASTLAAPAGLTSGEAVGGLQGVVVGVAVVGAATGIVLVLLLRGSVSKARGPAT